MSLNFGVVLSGQNEKCVVEQMVEELLPQLLLNIIVQVEVIGGPQRVGE